MDIKNLLINLQNLQNKYHFNCQEVSVIIPLFLSSYELLELSDFIYLISLNSKPSTVIFQQASLHILLHLGPLNVIIFID